MSKWIKFDYSNKKTWPPKYTCVLVYDTDLKIPTIGGLTEDGHWELQLEFLGEPTHWQHLPNPPETEGE